jgi:hypothetical protein
MPLSNSGRKVSPVNDLRSRSPALGAAAAPIAGRSFTPRALLAPPQQWDMRALCGLGTMGLLLIGLVASWLMPVRCQTRPITVALGASTDASVAMQAGRACTISVEISPTIIRAVSIETHPAHGRLMLRGRNGIVYVPDREFKGKDVFAFTLDSAAGRDAGTAVVRVAATVT